MPAPRSPGDSSTSCRNPNPPRAWRTLEWPSIHEGAAAMTRSAVVTGAAMGMGMLMARKLAQRGWRVFAGVMPGLDTSELTSGVKLTVIRQNVTDQEMVRAGAREVAAALAGDGLDLLINNAGIANIA